MRRIEIAALVTAVGLAALIAGFLLGVDFANEPENIKAPAVAARLSTTTTSAAGASTTVAAEGQSAATASSVTSATELAARRDKPFQTMPDYSNDPAGVCTARPCFQPIFDRPGGKRITDGWPCEYYDQASYSPEAPYCAGKTTTEGDVVTVTCQFQDRDVHGSTWWDRVEIPEEHLVQGHGLVPVDGKYYGVAPDRWLGNTGDRGIPCS